MLKRDFSDIVYRALANYFDVQVINSNIKRTGKKILVIPTSSSEIVAAGSYEIITIQPPQGKIWKVIYFFFLCDPPSGATSGDHEVSLASMGRSSTEVPYVLSNYNVGLQVRGYPVSYSGMYPEDLIAVGEYYKTVMGTYDRPILLRYYNGTDVDQANTRNSFLIVEELDEVS